MAKGPREIIGVRKDDDGDITHVKLKGNQRVTPLETAVKMAERGEIDRHHKVNGESKDFLRSNPDKTGKNNLDELPEV